MLKKTLINFGVVSAALLLTFACAEFLFRAFGVWTIPNSIPDWYRPATVAGVPFVLKPDLHAQWGLGSVISNADGLRDARAPNAGKTSFRVLALGDSVTFGFGVDQNDTFPRWMEKLAADAGGGAEIEVINAGMNGFNAQNEADFLPYLLDRYKADAVVWTLIGNDFDDSLAVAPNGEITWPAEIRVRSTSSRRTPPRRILALISPRYIGHYRVFT